MMHPTNGSKDVYIRVATDQRRLVDEELTPCAMSKRHRAEGRSLPGRLLHWMQAECQLRSRDHCFILLVLAWLVMAAFVFILIHRSLGGLGPHVLSHTDPTTHRDTFESGVRDLQRWMFVADGDTKLSKYARAYLREAALTYPENTSILATDLSALSSLWVDFRSKYVGHHLDAEEADHFQGDTARLSMDDLVTWGGFLQHYLDPHVSEDTGRLEAAEEENVEKKKHEDGSKQAYVLEPDVLKYLTYIVEEMTKDRLPLADLGEQLNIHKPGDGQTEDDLPAWKRLQNHMRRHVLYSPDDPALHEAIDNLKTGKIVGLETVPEGTQIKVVFKFEDGMRALAKPQRMSVDEETPVDRYYFDDFERFQAEVAAYHLDRIFEFHRVPPVAARLINLVEEVEKFAPEELQKTFYNSIADNVCFFGNCIQFCNSAFAVCGDPEEAAMSMAFYLPSRLQVGRREWVNPWKQSYSHYEKAEWQTNDSYCGEVRDTFPFNETRHFLDIMDMSAFDFVMGNLDRHHYYTFDNYGNHTGMVWFDNGRGFGRSYKDEVEILAPVYQCCQFRFSTLARMLALYTDDQPLSAKLRASLATEMVAPLLNERHLRTVDKRLAMTLKTVYDCVMANKGRYKDVVIDDGY